MSMSFTSLQLINRVNRRRRIPDSVSIADLEELTTLDAVNKAMSEVLSAKRWEFDIRHDQLTTRPPKGSQPVEILLGASSGFISDGGLNGLIQADVIGDYITRLILPSSTNYADTALRFVSSATVQFNLSAFVLAAPFPELVSVTDGKLLYYEYILPETVSNVIRVTHQEEELSLEHVGATSEFAEDYPRASVEFNSPRIVSVGGFERSTYATELTAPDPGLKMTLWPIPDDEYILDYTFDYRHPTLTTVTSTLDGVPPEVVDTIVDLATSDMQANYDRRVKDALYLRSETLNTIENIHNRHSGSYAERSAVHSWQGGTDRDRNSIHRGRTIGGN